MGLLTAIIHTIKASPTAQRNPWSEFIIMEKIMVNSNIYETEEGRREGAGSSLLWVLETEDRLIPNVLHLLFGYALPVG